MLNPYLLNIVSFKIAKILALASSAILALLFILNLFTFIRFFKIRPLLVIMGILMMLNGELNILFNV